MMLRKQGLILAALMVFGATQGVHAQDPREIGHDELRQRVQSGRMVALPQALSAAERAARARVIDIRAFDAGRVYYRVLMLRETGRYVSVVVDGTNGALVPANSRRAVAVRQAAAEAVEAGNAPSLEPSERVRPDRRDPGSASNGRGTVTSYDDDDDRRGGGENGRGNSRDDEDDRGNRDDRGNGGNNGGGGGKDKSNGKGNGLDKETGGGKGKK